MSPGRKSNKCQHRIHILTLFHNSQSSLQNAIFKLQPSQSLFVTRNNPTSTNTTNMANIMRRVMSFRSLTRPSSPPTLEDEDTLVDSPEPHPVRAEGDVQEGESVATAPFFNFPDQGITDHTTILTA